MVIFGGNFLTRVDNNFKQGVILCVHTKGVLISRAAAMIRNIIDEVRNQSFCFAIFQKWAHLEPHCDCDQLSPKLLPIFQYLAFIY